MPQRFDPRLQSDQLNHDDLFAPVLVSLTQLEDLIERLADEQYISSYMHSNQQPQQGVGPHVRHCIDHFKSLATGIEKGTVDYEDRDRNSPCGVSRLAALQCLEELKNFFVSFKLKKRGASALPLIVRVASESSKGNIELVTYTSTLGREIGFVASHTVHHLAVIKILGNLQGIVLEQDMGLAPGTQKWLREQPTCAR